MSNVYDPLKDVAQVLCRAASPVSVSDSAEDEALARLGRELGLTLASTPGQVELARRQAVLEFFAGAPHSHAR